jgi:hypothetical protein
MNTKTVYQTDEDGFYIGETIAFESPLEPGVYHIPRGCVEVQPPEVSFKERPRLVNNVWVKEIIYTEEEIKQIEEQIRLKAEEEQKRLEEQKKAEEERLRLEQEQERLRQEQEQERLRQEEELKKIEEKQREEEVRLKLEKEQKLWELKQIKIQLLEELLKTKEELNDITFSEFKQIQEQIHNLQK